MTTLCQCHALLTVIGKICMSIWGKKIQLNGPLLNIRTLLVWVLWHFWKFYNIWCVGLLQQNKTTIFFYCRFQCHMALVISELMFSSGNISINFTSIAMYNWQLTIYLKGRNIYFSRKILILLFVSFFLSHRGS